MAAGIVYHNITTASGVTFSIACWVPDTSAPDVGAIPVTVPINSSGVPTGGDGTNGLDVDVTRLSALVAGSAIIGKVGVDQTTPGTTNGVVVNNANSNGRATPANSAPVVLNSMTYQPVAVSTTQQCGATGATGDYLDGVLIIPGAAAAGVVQIKDGSGSAINIFAGGGTTALPTLAPFYVPIGAISSGGAGGWKVITNANVTAIGIGNFT